MQPAPGSDSPQSSIQARLTDVLRSDPDLILAYVFGTVAEGRATRASDVDVAVLAGEPFADEHLRNSIRAIAEATGRSVDLVDLRDAGVPLSRVVLSEGTELLCRDRRAKELLITRMLADVEDILALNYRRLDWDIVHAITNDGLDDFRRFAASMARLVDD